MRRAWEWLTWHLPEPLLSAFGRVPLVVQTSRARHEREKNAFDLGRDYERELKSERTEALAARVDRLEAEAAELVSQDPAIG